MHYLAVQTKYHFRFYWHPQLDFKTNLLLLVKIPLDLEDCRRKQALIINSHYLNFNLANLAINHLLYLKSTLTPTNDSRMQIWITDQHYLSFNLVSLITEYFLNLGLTFDFSSKTKDLVLIINYYYHYYYWQKFSQAIFIINYFLNLAKGCEILIWNKEDWFIDCQLFLKQT